MIQSSFVIKLNINVDFVNSDFIVLSEMTSRLKNHAKIQPESENMLYSLVY